MNGSYVLLYVCMYAFSQFFGHLTLENKCSNYIYSQWGLSYLSLNFFTVLKYTVIYNFFFF